MAGAAGEPDGRTAPRLSVIVPATDTPPSLERCLDALRTGLRRDDELIVVDEPRRTGPAAARNAGATRAHGDVLVFVDSDVVVHPDALDRIRTIFSHRSELVAVFGSYDDTPAAPGVVSRFRNLLHHHVHQQAPGRAGTFWAGLGAVDRTAFVAVGGFDAARFPHSSIEDVELGMRLAEGGTIELEPLLQGTHLKHWTLVGMLRTDFARRGVPWVRLLLERGTSSSALNLGWRHRLSALLVVATPVAVARRRPAVALVAVAGLVVLNRSFYALLVRRLGPGGAAAGVGLHALHHLAGAAALPAGALAHLAAKARKTA
jgi:hypothetical protein